MRPLVVTPTYQEVENIAEFLRRVRDAVPDADVLVVDDNSPDGTADVAGRVAADLGRIDVLRRPKKIGLGDAYRAGFSVGIERGYDVLVQIDADLSHDPTALPLMFREVDNGADAVIGSRYVPGGSIL
jgi:dolichol-phosphate mannosyltransferase